MPGAPFPVADEQGVRDAVAAAASRTFARRAEEVPVARRFVRDILAGHPACGRPSCWLANS